MLRKAIDRLLQDDPSQPFYLGVTVVHVSAPGAALSPVSDTMDQIEIQNHDALTVNQAIEYLPGVSVDHKLLGIKRAFRLADSTAGKCPCTWMASRPMTPSMVTST